MKKLIILDLDNTLIYASFNKQMRAKVLFHFSKDLVIYERPFVREFIAVCHDHGDLAVFTTAVREYAEQVCEHLGINPIAIYSREDCIILNNWYLKSVPDLYFDEYDEITIYDDFPEIWDEKSSQKCRIICVPEFTGNIWDDGLVKLMF